MAVLREQVFRVTVTLPGVMESVGDCAGAAEVGYGSVSWQL